MSDEDSDWSYYCTYRRLGKRKHYSDDYESEDGSEERKSQSSQEIEEEEDEDADSEFDVDELVQSERVKKDEDSEWDHLVDTLFGSEAEDDSDHEEEEEEEDGIDWDELFGSEQDNSIIRPIVTFDAIPGLKLVRHALSHQEQMSLTRALIDNDFFAGDANQAMLFGELPDYIRWLETWVTAKYPDIFDKDITERKPLFNQAILNMYKRGEGIKSHVDLMRFEDGILIVSLISSCVMTMRPARQNATSYATENTNDSQKHDILLRPGDVLALSKEARYAWEHGIASRDRDELDNGDIIIERGTRLSVTLRRLKEDQQQEMHAMVSSQRQT